MKKTLNIIFIIVSILTILEFCFICGTFTGPIMMILTLIAGAANLIYSALNKHTNEAVLYVICTIALCMGYLNLM